MKKTNRKPRSDSPLDKMPENQREALERWLYEDGVSCAEAAKRVFNDFGLRTSETAVRGFYHRCSERRLLDRVAKRASLSQAVVDKFEQNAGNEFSAFVKLVNQLAMEESAKENPDVERLYYLGKLALDGKKEGREEQNVAIKEKQLALDREEFEFDAAEACLKKLPELKAISNNPKLDQQSKIQAIRQKLFGQLPLEGTI